MAKAKAGASTAWSPNPKRKRPGVHAKSKTSSLKRSKNWKKGYRGQGR